MNTVADEQISQLFGMRLPIVQGAMGGVAGPDLVAAVANAGALGILPIWARPVDNAAALIAEVKASTVRPFAVNLRADLQQTGHVEMALESGVSLFNVFWGDPTPTALAIVSGGGKFIATVGDGEAARRALSAGASALIAQGVEAGGHVMSEVTLEGLLDEVLRIADGVPVFAAGGIATPADVAKVLSLGASGALLGTRFAATVESEAHEDYKAALVKADEGATVRTTCFDGMWPDAPHRVLRNSTYDRWNAAGQPVSGQRPGEDDIVLQLGDFSFPRYSMMPPVAHMSGDLEAGAMYAGCGVARIRDCPPAADVIRDLVSLIGSR